MAVMQDWAGSGDTRLTGDGQQLAPAVAALAGGGHVVAWRAATGDGTFEVRAQRFDAGGSKIGPELVLNDAPAYGTPGLVALADGGFLATWDSSPNTAPTDYIGRRFAADGAPLGASFTANDTTNPDPTAISVEPTALAGGGFVMQWWANAGAPTWWGPVLQVYDAAGAPVGSDMVLAPGIGSLAIAPDHDGGFFALWSGGSGNFLQRFDSAGNAVAEPAVIPTSGGSMEAAVLGNGDLAVSTLANNSGYWSLMVQRLDSQGQALDGQQALFTLPGSITDHKVTALADGGFVVSWLLYGQAADGSRQLGAQRFDAWGTKVGGEMTVGVMDSHAWPVYSAAATPDGGIVFAWDTTSTDSGDIYVEQFVPTGTPIPDQSPPVATSFSPPDERYGVPIDTNIVVTFNEPVQKGSGTIVLRDNGVVVATYDASSPHVTVSGNTLTIDPDQLGYDSFYQVEFSAGSVTDLAGNPYAGTTAYNFRTQPEPDYTPPQLLWSDPTSGESWVDFNDSTLWFKFSEGVAAQPTAGPIVLKTGDGAVVATWDQITTEPMAADWAYLNLPAPLAPDTAYRLEFPSGAAVDSAGNPLASVALDFRTAAPPPDAGASLFTPGPSGQANTLAAGDQTGPEIAQLADGTFLVVWASIPAGSTSALDSEIRGQRYDATGTKMGGEMLLAQDASMPLVAGLEGGGFALTWSGPRVPGQGTTTMFTQRFDAGGQPLGDPVAPNTSQSIYVHPSQTLALDGGGYLVVMSDRVGSHWMTETDILVQRFDANGAKVGGEIEIGSSLNGWEVTPVAGGGWALITQHLGSRYGGLGEFQTTLFDGSGALVARSVGYGNGFYPELATLANGTVLASNGWQFEMFDAAGVPLAPPVDFDLPGVTREILTSMVVTPWGDSGFLGTWKEVDASNTQTGTVLAQYFDAAAHAVGAPVQVPGTSIAPTPDGGFLVAFEVANAGTGKDVQVQKFEAVPPPPGSDTVAPSPIDFFPAAGSNTLPPEWSLAITFDEAVQAGAGTITLRTAAGQVVQTFEVASDPGIRFIDRSVVIDPAADLQPGTTYELVVSAGAVQDLAGNAFAGVSGHSFTTAGSAPPPGDDATAPTAIDFFPAAGSNTLPSDWSLGITFDEAVQAGAGTIALQTADGQVVQTFATATDPGIRFSGSSVIIDPAADLLPGTTYQLVVGSDAISDLSGNAYAGVSGYSFTTAGTAPPDGQDATPPSAIDFFPASGSNTLPPDWSLGITFDEAVQAGAGTITLQTAAGQIVQTFVAAGDPGIHFTGASVIIDPSADLQPGTTYHLVVANDAIEDLAGNPYAGVSGHSFTTAGSEVANLVALVGMSGNGGAS